MREGECDATDKLIRMMYLIHINITLRCIFISKYLSIYIIEKVNMYLLLRAIDQ